MRTLMFLSLLLPLNNLCGGDRMSLRLLADALELEAAETDAEDKVETTNSSQQPPMFRNRREQRPTVLYDFDYLKQYFSDGAFHLFVGDTGGAGSEEVRITRGKEHLEALKEHLKKIKEVNGKVRILSRGKSGEMIKLLKVVDLYTPVYTNSKGRKKNQMPLNKKHLFEEIVGVDNACNSAVVQRQKRYDKLKQIGNGCWRLLKERTLLVDHNADNVQKAYQKNVCLALGSDANGLSASSMETIEAWVQYQDMPRLVPQDLPHDSPQEKSCEREYAVEFKLAGMHSYLTVPTCAPQGSLILYDQGNPPQSRIVYNPKLCGRCDTDEGGRAEIHWNIFGCTNKLCIWPDTHATHALGPAQGLKMHPKCAWNIIRQLGEVYQNPYRSADIDGALRALGNEVNSLSNWADVLSAGFTGGLESLAKQAAEKVPWNDRLDLKCKRPRSLQKILEKETRTNETGKKVVTPIGAVCWNNIIDFHDLWCHWKKKLKSMMDETECDQMLALPQQAG